MILALGSKPIYERSRVQFPAEPYFLAFALTSFLEILVTSFGLVIAVIFGNLFFFFSGPGEKDGMGCGCGFVKVWWESVGCR